MPQMLPIRCALAEIIVIESRIIEETCFWEDRQSRSQQVTETNTFT